MEEFKKGNYKAILRNEKPVRGGPTKVFSVEWYKGGTLLQSTEGYEDYKFARAEAEMILNYYAREA